MPSRRTLLRTATTAVVPVHLGTKVTAEGDSESTTTLRVHVHRVPTVSDWLRRRVRRAVERGVEQVARTANARLDRTVDHVVTAGGTAPSDRIVTATRDAVHDSTIEWLSEADRLALDALHLILVDEPFSQVIGYGQNRAPLDAALADGEPAVSYANVGATEQWDAAGVTENIAIHEVLHGLVTAREATAVLGRGCEHDLGAVHPVADRGAIVTPMATAYADPRFGIETQWPGSGCLGRLARHVRFQPDWWGHTYALSAATQAATTRYVARL